MTDKNSLRIILIRHGRPALPVAPRTSHRGFHEYIDAYEEAGLDSDDLPPAELLESVREIGAIFSSGRKRADESAKVLAPQAELLIDPLFVEAPLASPHIPILRMKVTKWAVVARILWHAGYHPDIEDYRKVKRRVVQAADILVARARQHQTVALVAHGYFNFMIGRELLRRGFRKSGSHRAKFWNAVVYARAEPFQKS